jgi:teichuronic acid biosynthesis glycosyltransferase TuaG
MVFFTILTPVYNGIEFLEECIQSVRAQTFSDWEMLIGINGHGPDGGEIAQIAMKLSENEPRIRVIIQGPPLKGKVESLNHLVTFASCDWIAILDCDDKWTADKLNQQHHTICTTAPDADVIGTYCKYFGERDDTPPLHSGYIDPSVLERVNTIVNSSGVIRKKYCYWELNDINYTMDDYHLWMKICLSGGKLYNIPIILTWHRIHHTSAFNTKGQSPEPLQEWYKHERMIMQNR